MKTKQFLLMGILLSGAFLFAQNVSAAPQSVNQSGNVSVVDSGVTDPEDPENPGEVVDPEGGGPSTKGLLRFDYASSLDFGSHDVANNQRTFQAFAQQFNGPTPARGSYVQLTDRRTDSQGWSLQVKQTNQFVSGKNDLSGAVLSLDKAWANSYGDSPAPGVTRTTSLKLMNTAYEVAKADVGQGKGVWMIQFGASGSNQNGQENSLTPVKDASGNPVMNKRVNKPEYYNSAIQLAIPNQTNIAKGDYTTELTWILAELP